MEEPSIGMLASAAGLAGVVWLIMQVLRTAVPPDFFDRWGAVMAVIVGVVLALLYAFVTTPDITGSVLLQALLVGLFGGWLSQNANTMVRRAAAGPPKT
jgi:hypothetical protein